MGKKLDLKKQNKQKQLSVLTSSAGSVRMWTQQLVVELQPLTPAAAEFHQRQHRTFSLVCFNNSLGARCSGYCSLWVCVRLTWHRPATDRVWGRDLGWVNLLNNSSAKSFLNTSCLNQGSEQHTLSVQVKPPAVLASESATQLDLLLPTAGLRSKRFLTAMWSGPTPS